MVENQDRIRVWNEETSEMIDPGTIQEMLREESNNGNAEGAVGMDQYPVDSNEYDHLVFMRNTGIYAQSRKEYVDSARYEIFAEDLITHSIEPFVYRVIQQHGCWWAMSLSPANVQDRPLKYVHHARIVGNVFENKELVLKGEIIDE